MVLTGLSSAGGKKLNLHKWARPLACCVRSFKRLPWRSYVGAVAVFPRSCGGLLVLGPALAARGLHGHGLGALLALPLCNLALDLLPLFQRL